MKNLVCILLVFAALGIKSQGIAISPTNSLPDPSAVLDLQSTTKGLLPPRLTTQQMNSVASPAIGLMIFNLDCNAYEYWNGRVWVSMGNIGGLNAAGSITGNLTPCVNATGIIYSIAAVSGATSYNWIVPQGASITAGQGSDSITVSFGSNSGSVCVTASNACATSNAICASVSVGSATSTPTAGAATNVTCNSFSAVWSAATGATVYYLDVATDAGFSNILSSYNNLNVGNALTAGVTGLSPNTTYYYRVRAFNSCNTSANSNTISVGVHQPYVPIILANGQGSATPANFQQMITVNSSIYSSYENGGLQNIEFTTGPYATGNVLQAWIESGASSGSGSTVYWINLGSSSIPGNGNLTIYMNFMSSNVMSSSGPTGEAPQLSGSYGQYDNGANVFSLYTNWAGNSLPSGWTTSVNGGSYTVNNGLTCFGSGGSIFVYYNTQLNPVGNILESYFANGTGLSDAHDELVGWGINFTGGSGQVWWGWNTGVFAGLHNTTEVGMDNGFSFNCSSSGSGFSYPQLVSLSWQSTSTQLATFNYSSNLSCSGTFPSLQNSYPVGGYISSGGQVTYTWFRLRTLPPGNSMPGVSVGSVSC